MASDSTEYKKKKAYFDSLLTVYGRKPVLEALQSQGAKPVKLHLSERNKPAAILDQIINLTSSEGAEVCYHSPAALSRISKNARQDQGVALDLKCQSFQTIDKFLAGPMASTSLIALDRVTNPQNLGMIIRSVAASPMTALIIPTNGCAPLNSLVIKASAGALFRAPIIQVRDLDSALEQCQTRGFRIASLEPSASESLMDYSSITPTVFVLGNETDGVSEQISKRCNLTLKIPMQRGVESLNVAVTAALIAFLN